MISLTRLNGDRMVVNVDLIRTVEANPDTTIRFVNGEHVVVRESLEEIVEKAIDYGRHLRSAFGPVSGRLT